MLVPVLALALMLAGPQSSRPAQDDPRATNLPTIEVEGQRRPAFEAARDFTREVLATVPSRGIARWRAPICPGVLNLQRDAAQAILDRIADRVRELDLQAAEPGCRPNVIIVGATDGAAMASEMVEEQRLSFLPGHDGATLTRRALNVFRTSDAPVRWWQLSLPMDSDSGLPTVRMRGADPDQPVYRDLRFASRLRSQDTNAIYREMIVVDVNRIGTVDVARLGDYLSMVILAQVDAEADFSRFDTVLNLFDDPAGVSGMTDWDRVYLRELYSARLDASNVSHQIGEIAGAMVRSSEQDTD